MSTYTSEPGTRLGGRYRLEDRLAEASGWSAWKAIDEILARPVSVITFAAGFPRLDQVMTAARAASRLTDTRLTQVFDVEDSWERGYIVLEWPVGDTLGSLLTEGSIEPAAAARVVAEAAAALSGAHAAGLAHLCLRPDAIRWTAAGGVKVTGLGIDAALTGVEADDPEAADTRGLGRLLYAALTGLWPGQDLPELPPVPTADGVVPRPREIRPSLSSALDEVTARALALPGTDAAAAYTSPAELSAALSAAIPPLQLPALTASQLLRDGETGGMPQWRDSVRNVSRTPPLWPGSAQQQTTSRVYPDPAGFPSMPPPPARRRSAGRLAAAIVVVLAVAAAAGVGVAHLLNKSSPTATSASSPAAHPSAGHSTAVIRPVAAQGFDALNLADSGNENTDQAANVLDGNPAGWSTQQYFGSPYFGHLKAGTGLILDLGKPVQVSSVTVTFGDVPGANVQIKVGSSDERSKANLAAMTTLASKNDVSGSTTFTATATATGRYVVIWFTKLPPTAGSQGRFSAQIMSVVVRGLS